MPEPVIMPKLEMDMEDALIVEWYRQEGDEVKEGDALFAIETSKASLDVDAECSGILLKIVEPENTTVDVTRTVAWIGEAGEEIPEEEERETVEVVQEDAAPIIAEVEKTATVAGKIPATPAAKTLAAERNIDLADVVPSGIHGECRKRDVEAMSSSGRRESLSPLRREMAARMVKSGCNVPQATIEIKADVTELSRMRKEVNATRGIKLTITDYIAVAVSKTLCEFPDCNSRLDGNEIVYNDSVHLGIAVATERGLIVPVVRDAETLGIEEISSEIQRLATSAREGTLLPAEFTGSTFTISNLGMFGITSFTPILNTPEAAILGVCAAEDVLVLENAKPASRLRINLCLTIDHRLLDGAIAAMFLGRIKEHLEQPKH